MPKVRYSNKAVEDLTSIWEYTLSEWSESQADEYYEMLISACNHVKCGMRMYLQRYNWVVLWPI